MKIVIAGATSFIARRVVNKISAAGWEVTAVVRRTHKLAKGVFGSDVNIVRLDMDEYCRLGEHTGKADCFINFAWEGTRGLARLDSQIQQRSFDNSIAAIKSMINQGCRKILTAGSQAEYGNCKCVITEDTTCRPNTEYGKWKLKLYEDARDFCEKSDGVVLIEPRIFSIYGPGDYENSMIMSICRRMLSNADCELTECTQMWDYLYVDDAAEAIKRLCICDCESGIYNVANGDVRPLREYIDEMKAVTGSGSELCYGAVDYPETGVVSIMPSVRKIQETVGWKPEVDFAVGMTRIVDDTMKLRKI